MDNRLYYNGYGVKDPTAFQAIKNIMKEERKNHEGNTDRRTEADLGKIRNKKRRKSGEGDRRSSL